MPFARPPQLLDLERAGVKAWPALETRPIGGWLWRHSHGGSQRANSVAALAEPGVDVEDAIDEAERLYFEAGAQPRFQVTDAAAPAGLDQRLARRGYRINDPCTTLVAPLSVDLTAAADAEIADDVTLEWHDTYTSVVTADRRSIAARILRQIPPGSAFCGLRRNGRLVATTLVVIDGPIAVVECVATRAEARRTGAGAAILQAAMGWAASQGATAMALGALADNLAAQLLYKKLGFRLAGRYHIRVKE